ncbi:MULTISPECIES: LuxR C-terminal-related transcriptional regulator [Novosphingobium]|uniref:LuxR C-terminal-related transcriptional regulator n=1 Tax=Novosphingobium sp. ST904 TaxID=1684385 RepID=UPI0006C86B7C|nr:LuxR C-terminal-related transcriptional regulator [Novosphingobium sp. ST904]TCM41544.1 regulatory LuxR family protein [Novosphingobium sp. ST904]
MNNTLNIILIDDDNERKKYVTSILKQVDDIFNIQYSCEFTDLSARHPTIALIGDNDNVLDDFLVKSINAQRIPVVIYSLVVNVRRIVELISKGAADYVIPTKDMAELRDILTRAASTADVPGRYHPRESAAASLISRLTKREHEVLIGVAKGQSNRLIGKELSISPRTVEIHRANMIARLGAKNTMEAIRIAIEAGKA